MQETPSSVLDAEAADEPTPAAAAAGSDGPEGPAAILGDTVIGLLKVGKVVGAMERAAAAATLDNWSAEFGADVVPSNERVQQIIDNEDVPSLSDFLSIYDAKANVELKSARVWPPDAPMRY